MAEPTNIKVMVRIRPVLEHEKGTHQATCIESGSNYVSLQTNSSLNNKVFTFDRVLDQVAEQANVFEEAEPLIDHALDGLHATIFCYGQTGSGKTFTMEGFDYAVNESGKLKPLLNTPKEQHGVILRTIESIYAKINERMRNNSHIRYKIHCSYMQIYNERVFDLLNANNTLRAAEKRGAMNDPGLRIRWRKNDQFYVENLFVFECDSADQVRELFQMGVKNKNMGSHQMNLASSRSHSLFTLYINSWDPDSPDCVIKSELTLVDLAGSEKLSLLAKNPSQRLLQESIDINTSLLALGKVIAALGSEEKPVHVPYRDSKLTCLLKHALGGNSMTMMIACISPCDAYLEETMCTLFYAGRARNIKNDPRINEDPKSALIRALKNEIAELKLELENYRKLLLDEDGSLASFRFKKGRLVAADGGTDTPSSSNAIADGVKSGNDDYLAEKLIDSVRILRELVTVNGQLRTNFDKINELKVQAEAMVQQVNEENVELRERVEMLESIVVQQADFDEPEEGSAADTNANPAVPVVATGGGAGGTRAKGGGRGSNAGRTPTPAESDDQETNDSVEYRPSGGGAGGGGGQSSYPSNRRRPSKKAISQYNQRYKSKMTQGLPNYHEYYNVKPQAARTQSGGGGGSNEPPAAATATQSRHPAMVEQQRLQQQQLQAYQQQHMQQLQQAYYQQQQMYQQQQQQYAQYQRQQQQQQVQPQVQPGQAPPSSTQQLQSQTRSMPAAPQQTSQPNYPQQQQQPPAATAQQPQAQHIPPPPSVVAAQQQYQQSLQPPMSYHQQYLQYVAQQQQLQANPYIHPQHNLRESSAYAAMASSAAQATVGGGSGRGGGPVAAAGPGGAQQGTAAANSAALQQAKTAAEAWLQHQRSNIQQQNSAALQQQSMALQGQITTAARMQQGAYPLPKMPEEVVRGQRTSVISSPMRPQNEPMTSAASGSGASPSGGSSGYLTTEEYQKYFTPEQLQILQRRNVLNSNFVQGK